MLVVTGGTPVPLDQSTIMGGFCMTGGPEAAVVSREGSERSEAFEDGGEAWGPAGGAEFGVADAFAAAGCGGSGRDGCSFADGGGEVVATSRGVVDGIEDARQLVRADVEEGVRGVVAMDEVDARSEVAEHLPFARAGGVDEARAAGAVDPAESHNRAAGVEGDFFRREEHVSGGGAAGWGRFVDEGSVLLRINRGAAGEDDKSRPEYGDEVLQSPDVSDLVSCGVASGVPAQAVDEHIGLGDALELGGQTVLVGRVGDEDAVRFVRQAGGGLGGADHGGDVPTAVRKKIRASLTGVTAAGEEDARSWERSAQERLKRNFILARLALAFALRRDFWVGVS